MTTIPLGDGHSKLYWVSVLYRICVMMDNSAPNHFPVYSRTVPFSAEPPLEGTGPLIMFVATPVLLRLDPHMSDRVISNLSQVVISVVSRSLTLLEDRGGGMRAVAHILLALAHLPSPSSILRPFFFSLSPTPPAGYLTFVLFGLSFLLLFVR